MEQKVFVFLEKLYIEKQKELGQVHDRLEGLVEGQGRLLTRYEALTAGQAELQFSHEELRAGLDFLRTSVESLVERVAKHDRMLELLKMAGYDNLVSNWRGSHEQTGRPFRFAASPGDAGRGARRRKKHPGSG